MQFELEFNGEADAAAAAPPAAGPAGLLTGRPWRRAAPDPSPLLPDLRRRVPLPRPASDRLLALLAGRGLTDAAALDRFFFPTLEQLHDPFALAEMEPAVARVLAAVRRGERVAVHGDFDVDGITGTALLTLLLRELRVDGRAAELLPPFVPDRLRDGYGVSARQLDLWAREGVKLLLTVDTGAAAREELERARQAGVEAVVLDHHLFRSRPAAAALVNPRREDNAYPNPDLSGVGVAFKLAQAIRQAAPAALPERFLADVLDLVALGLVADQMPLVGENRVLVTLGLRRLRERPRPGLAELLRVAGLDKSFPVTANHLAYQLSPRLNACGRVGKVQTALDLLLTDDRARARRLAEEADQTNRERQRLDQAVKEEAAALAAPFVAQGDRGLVLASPGWHKGVIGIGAARLVEQYHVPSVLIAIEGDEARGSARSVAGVDIKAVLDRCARLLPRYGGHAQAAGLTLRADDVDAFRREFLAALAEAPGGGPPPELFDLELPLAEMTAGDAAALVAELEQLEPFGSGNREPVFRCDGLRLQGEPRTLGNGDHLRFAFRGPAQPPEGGSPALAREFVAFGAGTAWRAAREAAGGWPADQAWDVLFRLARSTWRPRSGADTYDPVQQQLVDLRPADRP